MQQRLTGAGALAADKLGDGIEAAGGWAQGVWQGLFGGDRTPDTFTSGGVEVSPPFTGKATRGDFVWKLAIDNPDLGLGGGDRDAVLAAAEARGILTREHARVITRAEAAAVLVRALGLPTTLPAEQVAHFQDVTDRQWFFDVAHAARRHGLFHGDAGSNTFRGGDGLRVDDPFGALERAANGTYTYYRGASGNQLNAKDETGGAGARGEDNLWSWQTVADTVRYVQWHRPAGVGNS